MKLLRATTFFIFSCGLQLQLQAQVRADTEGGGQELELKEDGHSRSHSRSRLQCLQQGFGKEGGGGADEQQQGHWVRAHLEAGARQGDEEQWMYDHPQCRFAPFDNEQFCQQ